MRHLLAGLGALLPVILRIHPDPSIDSHIETTGYRSIESLETMLASEAVLRRDWDRPEEDAAWQNL